MASPLRSLHDHEKEVYFRHTLPAGYTKLLLPDGHPLYGKMTSMRAGLPPKLAQVRVRESNDFMARLARLMEAAKFKPAGVEGADHRENEWLGRMAWTTTVVRTLLSDMLDQPVNVIWAVPFGVRVCVDLILQRGQQLPDAQVQANVVSLKTTLRALGPRMTTELEERALLLLWFELEIASNIYDAAAFSPHQSSEFAFNRATRQLESQFKHGPFTAAARLQELKELNAQSREIYAGQFGEGQQITKLQADKETEKRRKRRDNLRSRKGQLELAPGVPGGPAASSSSSSAPGIAIRNQPGQLHPAYTDQLTADVDPFFGLVVERGAQSETDGVREREAEDFIKRLTLIDKVVFSPLKVEHGDDGIIRIFKKTDTELPDNYEARVKILSLTTPLQQDAARLRLANRPGSLGKAMSPFPFAMQVINASNNTPDNMDKLYIGLCGAAAFVDRFGAPGKRALRSLLAEIAFARKIRFSSNHPSTRLFDEGVNEVDDFGKWLEEDMREQEEKGTPEEAAGASGGGEQRTRL